MKLLELRLASHQLSPPGRSYPSRHIRLAVHRRRDKVIILDADSNLRVTVTALGPVIEICAAADDSPIIHAHEFAEAGGRLRRQHYPHD